MRADSNSYVRLGDISQVQTGPFGGQLHASDYKDSGIPIITVEHLGENKVIHRNLPLVSNADRERLSRYSLREGDIVFSRVGAIDRRAYIGESEEGWLFSGRLLRVRPENRMVDGRFLSFLLGHPEPMRWIYNHAVGSTMACLNTTILSHLPLRLVPLCEQQRIAEILDAVDKAIAKTEAVIAKLKQVRTGLLQDLLTRGLGEHGQLRDPIAHPEQFKDSPLGRIPKEWALERIGDEVEIEHGFAFDGRYFSDKPLGAILLVPGNFHRDGGLYFVDSNTKYFTGRFPPETVLSNGDVLIVMTDLSPMTLILGRTVLLDESFPVLHNQRIGKFRFKGHLNWNPRFFVTLMNDQRLRGKVIREATGTTVRHTSPERIRNGVCVRPPRHEQDEIVAILECQDANIGSFVEESHKLNSLKSGLMSDLLSGRVPTTAEGHSGRKDAT